MNSDPLTQPLAQDGLTFAQWYVTEKRKLAREKARLAKRLSDALTEAEKAPEDYRWQLIADARISHSRKESHLVATHEIDVGQRQNLHRADYASTHWYENHPVSEVVVEGNTVLRVIEVKPLVDLDARLGL